MEKVADKRVGKPLSLNNIGWRVKCDLTFSDAKVAVAFKRIVESFETSATKRDGNHVHSA